MFRRALLVASAVALVALAVGASVASAGGNSANAKLCQKGGWKDLVRADQTPFANQGACVSYAAQGGTLTAPSPPAPPAPPSAAQILCESFDGTFVPNAEGRLWDCNGWSYSQLNLFALAGQCGNDGGAGWAVTDNNVLRFLCPPYPPPV